MQKVLFKEFLDSEKSCGFILLVCVALSLLLSNTPIGEVYQGFWQMEVFGHSLVHIINDGLMTLFFLLIGLELEREIYVGELRRWRDAVLPLFAAVGGMLVPAAIYYMITSGTPYVGGVGIPMATDIAFAIGILSLLGNRVPAVLKVFLVALAVIDDLGAILVIAIFYATDISWMYLGLALLVFLFLLVLNRSNVLKLWPYLLGGVAMWYFMLLSGVHPTLSGVLLAFAIPFRNHSVSAPSFRLQHYLTKPIGFAVLPLFALANTAIAFTGDGLDNVFLPSGIGALLGLLVGKPLGIMLFVFIAVWLGAASKPKALKWKYILGVGLLAGIGFTMSIFITLLSFDSTSLISGTKVAILLASLLSGILGYVWLTMVLPHGDKQKKTT